MRLVLPALALSALVACAGSGKSPASPADADPRDPPEPEPQGTVTEWAIGDQPDNGPVVFQQDVIHQINIELEDDATDSLYRDPYEEVLSQVVIDDMQVPDVGVRLRGKVGSFRTLDGKPKLEIDFNTFVDGQRFQGLESLSLNNSVVDCSYLKETVGYRVFEALGVPAARTAYAQVTINGLEYGLYVLVETQDDRFLKERWADDDGNLYDGKYIWYGGHDYQLLDFGSGLDTMYQLEEGSDVGHADISAISDTLIAAWGQPDFYEQMGEVIDWDALHREWAGEQWVGQNDGYCINQNNYRVYFNPETDRAELIPWDLDYAFLNARDWGRSWASPAGKLAQACWQDSVCVAAQQQAMAEALDIIDSMDLQTHVDALADLTQAAALDDPRRECARGDVLPWRDYIDDWVATRSDLLRDQWGL